MSTVSRENENVIASLCSRLSESVGNRDTVAVLSELLSLQRKIERDLSQQPPSESTEASTSRSNKRDEIFQALRLNLDSYAESLNTSIDGAEAIIDMSRSFIPPPHGDDAPPHEQQRSLPSVESILSYAHRLRYTTFAHAGLVSLPPAPQPAQMLNSTLFRHSLARAAEARPSTTASAHPDATQKATSAEAATADNPIATSSAGISALLSSELPPMPDGWKPGDPLPSFPSGFQLPEGIPEMPADWQPGDPLPGFGGASGTSLLRSSSAMDVDGVR